MTTNLSKEDSTRERRASHDSLVWTPLTWEKKSDTARHRTLAIVDKLETRLGEEQCRNAPCKLDIVWLANRLRDNGKTYASDRMHRLFQTSIEFHRRMLGYYASATATGEEKYEKTMKMVGHEYFRDQ